MNLTKSKRFWVAQGLVAVVTVAMFAQIITFDVWFTKVGIIEAAWGGLETAGKFSKTKGDES
jgi:uncharacterized membrane protein